MKLAVFSESEADEAAIRILVDGLLGTTTERPAMPPRRSRGVEAVFSTLRSVIAHLHYRFPPGLSDVIFQLNAEGSIVVTTCHPAVDFTGLKDKPASLAK